MKAQSLLLAGSVMFVAAMSSALAHGVQKESPSTPAHATQPGTASGYSTGPTSDITSAGGLGKTRAQVLQELQRAQESGELQRMHDFYGYGIQ